MPVLDTRCGAILVGSGISIPSGYPSVQHLTSLALTGKGAFRHTDDSYYVDDSVRRDACPYVGAAVKALALLKSVIDPSLQQYQYSGREAHYEDLVYVVRQLGDFALGEIENPVVGPFLQDQSERLDELRSSIHSHECSVGELMRQTENYVCDVVWRSLDREANSTEHLNVFLEALQAGSTERISIGTLNHDTHFERYLATSGLRIWDNFGPETNEVRYWCGTDIGLDDDRTPLFKLHGSVDWFEFRPDDGTRYDDRIGIPSSNEIWHTRSEDGRRQILLSGRPLMLVGTFNKYIDYSAELFAAIHARWRNRLSVADRLVVCGYGFGDRGINAQIVEWIYGSRDRKVLIINPNIEELKNRSRGAIRNRWNEWVDGGVLKTVDARIQDVDTGTVAKFLGS